MTVCVSIDLVRGCDSQDCYGESTAEEGWGRDDEARMLDIGLKIFLQKFLAFLLSAASVVMRRRVANCHIYPNKHHQFQWMYGVVVFASPQHHHPDHQSLEQISADSKRSYSNTLFNL